MDVARQGSSHYAESMQALAHVVNMLGGEQDDPGSTARQGLGHRDGLAVNAKHQTRLILLGGHDDGIEIPVLEPTVTMGRFPTNDLQIDEPSVSRRHAEVIARGDDYYVRDLGSTNGTFVNDCAIGAREYLLGDGDLISLGGGSPCVIFRHCGAATLRMTRQRSAPAMEAPETQLLTHRPREVAAPSHTDRDPRDEHGFGDDGLYEGNVKLSVQARGDTQRTVRFVQALRQKPQLRLLRLMSAPQADVDIRLGLREPLRLREVLAAMQEVSQVTVSTGGDDVSTDDEPVFGVLLS